MLERVQYCHLSANVLYHQLLQTSESEDNLLGQTNAQLVCSVSLTVDLYFLYLLY